MDRLDFVIPLRNFMKHFRPIGILLVATALFASLSSSARAATASELNRDAFRALHELFAKNPKAAEIANQPSAVLVFPTVIKAGFIFGAHGGDGVLMSNGVPISYYQTSAIS